MVDGEKVVGTITEVSTLAELTALLEANNKLVLFVLGGDCPHSANYLPVMQEMVNISSGRDVHFAKAVWPHIEGDSADIPQEMHAIIDKLGIVAVPTTVFFKGKTVQGSKMGLPSKEQLAYSIDKLIA